MTINRNCIQTAFTSIMKLKNRYKKMLWPCLLLTAGMAFALTGCESKPLSYSYRSTPVEGWEQGDTLHFHVDSVAHAGKYRMTLGIRYSATTPYPFQSLWLVVREHWHNPESVYCDTVECKLSNADGDIKGTGVSIYQVEQYLHDRLLQEGMSADITINHIMQREMLPGITDVGLRIE